MTVLLGVDVGTTSVKAVLFDLDSGVALAETTQPHQTDRGHSGVVEQDPEVWTRGLTSCWLRLHAQRPDVEIASIGVCSQTNTHVFVDDKLCPCRPAIVWQDQRCADVARLLDAEIGDAERAKWWGGPFAIEASFALSRIQWVKQYEPHVWLRTRWVLSPKDYVVGLLTGTVMSDPLSAIGLVDASNEYLDEVFALVPGSRRTAPPLASFDSCGGLTTGSLGLPSGVPVAVGTMDAWGSVYGSGVTSPGQGFQISGTSEVVGAVSANPGFAPGVVSFPPVRNRYIHAGPTQVGADGLRWLAGVFNVGIGQLLAEAGASRVSASPLLFLPHMEGERTPHWNPDAVGVFLGVSLSTTRPDFTRALMEGVAFAARQAFEHCEVAAGTRCETLRISGGGAKSAMWNAIKAAAHGRSLEVLECLATGSVGAALMGAAAAGEVENLEDAASRLKVREVVLVDVATSERLDAYFELYKETYGHLEPLFPRLRTVGKRSPGSAMSYRDLDGHR